MIEKVLIVEDHESANVSIQKTLEDIGISNTDYVYYCDDALSKIKTARELSKPYDLLITDLYFEEDSQVQKLTSGIELISAVRHIQPELKVIVFSAENKPAILDALFNKQQIDGYVRKARNDSKELHNAISHLAQNRQYLPRHIIQLISKKNSHDFSEFDITLISLLANGISQKNIPAYLKQKNLPSSGLSKIEKRLKHIKEALNFSKNEQLVAYCKDMGII